MILRLVFDWHACPVTVSIAWNSDMAGNEIILQYITVL